MLRAMTRSRTCAYVLSPLVVVVPLLVGCSDLSSYQGEFRGLVVGTEDNSFVRRGFPAGTEIELAFDPALARANPGTITTSDGRFSRTPLLFIAPLEHDELSHYDFPGGRVQSYIFASRSRELDGQPARDCLVFLSLMQDDVIEVRIVAGAGDEAAGDLFGLFRLNRSP
jgi:hypothetical protein